VLLDLDRAEEELLAAMKQKTRYNVRLAMRRGVTVREGAVEEIDTFYQLYAETSRRDGFPIRPPEYYRDGWGSFLEEGLAHLLLAEAEGETVAGLILFTFGPTAWYMYGASSDRHRRHMPNQLLQWEAIRRAREADCTLYDLWGAPDELDESDPMWGVVRFKLGLGGELTQGLGAWDFPANRAGYWFYTTVMPRYLDWLRSRHEAAQF
jgi:lipid II:glycine glycyltransferase (peptidoglycan interpeptide bridge formation enzyme)